MQAKFKQMCKAEIHDEHSFNAMSAFMTPIKKPRVQHNVDSEQIATRAVNRWSRLLNASQRAKSDFNHNSG